MDTLTLVILAAVAVIFGLEIYRIAKTGKVDQSTILTEIRVRLLEIIKIAVEMKDAKELGEDEVVNYIVDTMYNEIQETTLVSDAEKMLLTKDIIRKFVHTLDDSLEKKE